VAGRSPESWTAVFPAPIYIQGFYLYAFMIYADFSGYTDIARASAAFFGFNLPENFRQPYLSTTVTTFWNHWHMSLTQWFREYLFFPLSRKLLLVFQRKHAAAIQTFTT
jgi:alginate O-acetyltransferase complex protein AlgI